MAEEIKEFEIRTVADFLAIPPGKIIACLTDFAIWLNLMHQPEALESALMKTFSTQPGEIKNIPGIFRWRDDGKTGLSHVRLMSNETGKEICRLEIPNERDQAKALCATWTAALSNEAICKEAGILKIPIQGPPRKQANWIFYASRQYRYTHYRMPPKGPFTRDEIHDPEIQKRILVTLKEDRSRFLSKHLTRVDYWLVSPEQMPNGSICPIAAFIDATQFDTQFYVGWESYEAFV